METYRREHNLPKPLTDSPASKHLQASRAELHQALKERHAIELDGAWRTVEKVYMEGLLETARFLSVQQGWSHAALPQQDLVEGLQANGYDAR